MSAGLPTRVEMLQRALVDLDRARGALSDARDHLNSDWRPVGSELTDHQADARSTTRDVIGTCKNEIDKAKDAIGRALSSEAGAR